MLNIIYQILRVLFLSYILLLITMFDFLAHWFAKTEIVHNEKQEPKEVKRSFYKNGHFSLDLTFLTIVIVIVIAVYLYRKYKNNQLRKFKSKFSALDIEMQPQRSELTVERAPLTRQSTVKFCSSSDCNQNTPHNHL